VGDPDEGDVVVPPGEGGTARFRFRSEGRKRVDG